MRSRPRLRRVWRGPAPLIAGLGAAVFLVFWHADTLRLSPDGNSLVWPIIIAFGAGWAARGQPLVRAAAGVAVGSAAALLAVYGNMNLLPVTPLGTGIALGVTAAVLAALVTSSRGWLPAVPTSVSFGAGLGTAELLRITPVTGFSAIVTAWTAITFALLLGVIAVQVMTLVQQWTAAAAEEMPTMVIEPTEILQLPEPIPEEELIPVGMALAGEIKQVGPARPARRGPIERRPIEAEQETSVRLIDPKEEVYGPLLEPPETVSTTPRRQR